MSQRITIERNIKQDSSSKRYYVTLYYKNENGKKIRESKTVDTLKEARELRDKHEAAVTLNLKQKEVKRIKLYQCIQDYIDLADIQETTKYGYKNILNHISQHYISNKYITELKKNDILAYIKFLKTEQKQLSNSSINKHLDLINTSLNNAYQNEFVTENIMNKIKKLEVSNKFKGDFYTIKECRELFELLGKTEDYRLILAINLSIFCGLRRGEICGLKWEDVDLKEDKIHIKTTRTQAGKKYVEKTTKTVESNRILALPQHIKELIILHKENQEKYQKLLDEKYIENIAEYLCMPIKFESVFNGLDEKYLIVYSDQVMIKEPVCSEQSLIPDCQVIIGATDGIDRPLVKVETNMTSDVIVSSKNADTEIVAKGYVKIHASK